MQAVQKWKTTLILYYYFCNYVWQYLFEIHFEMLFIYLMAKLNFQCRDPSEIMNLIMIYIFQNESISFIFFFLLDLKFWPYLAC